MAGGSGGSGQHDVVAFSQTSQLTGEPPAILHLGMPPQQPSKAVQSTALQRVAHAPPHHRIGVSTDVFTGGEQQHTPRIGGAQRSPRRRRMLSSVLDTGAVDQPHPADLPRAELTRGGKRANTRRVEPECLRGIGHGNQINHSVIIASPLVITKSKRFRLHYSERV